MRDRQPLSDVALSSLSLTEPSLLSADIVAGTDDTKPKSHALKREPPQISTDNLPENFTKQFDEHTLFYDVIGHQNSVYIFCPRLMNLYELISHSLFYANGQKVSFHLSTYGERLHLIVLNGVSAEKIRIVNRYFDRELRVSQTNYPCFKGKNCLVTLSKNNPLNWIQDFVNYHVHEHAADAILLFDNGSSEYNLAELNHALAETNIESFLVVSAPFPYGPVLVDRNQQLQFLQIGLLNIARLRFLSEAKAVLSLDIDELVQPARQSIFKQTAQKTSGFLRFFGRWRYTKGVRYEQITHADHHYLQTPPKNHVPVTERSDKKHHKTSETQKIYTVCPPKYCYVPSKLPIKIPLDIHGFSISNTLLRKAVHFWVTTRKQCFWHLSGLTTNWKGKRPDTRAYLSLDPELKDTFDRLVKENVLRPASEHKKNG